ncbi:sensor histidine kinase [Alkalihalobacillus sp. LMS39]|uniref:sensor histidine kinase n=1 Tax=Alkalihalobacillus sp. LMS39 TaxID=2924032 RepID=UPI001FB47758|nr:sensor histidine kinase [Alkalihalobacillus sp. LMS39]UOE95274.1 sensor histidine kinase [Alkalihalobacillus sp. LMS39]
MKLYFIWLAIHFLVWSLAILQLSTINEAQISSLSLFFLILFILPLFSEKKWIQTGLFCVQLVSLFIIFYPTEQWLSPFVLLLHALLFAEAVYYLDRVKSQIVLGVQMISVVFLVSEAMVTTAQYGFGSLFYLFVILACFYYQTGHIRLIEIQKQHNALLDEYRKMKRQLVIEEEQARLDERVRIGHEIHDSVGHKLTALLMQLEALRLSAEEKDKEKIGTLKNLAGESLDETRRAVKSFKQRDIGGLQGVIRLIRKLEMESFMKIHFSVKHGAFAAPLSGEQSFAIYRAVQEALTNIMKHSSTREAEVMFESPGGSVFRFEVSNQAPPNPFFHEGYGLKAMRERIEQVGGTLEIEYDRNEFIVRGIIRLTERRG